MSALSAVPSGGGRTELRLAGRAVVVLAVLAVPVLGVAALANGRAGLAGAAAGLALVGVLFGAAGLAQGLAARRSSAAVAAAVALGVGVRLALYLAALDVLGRVAGLHRPSLAIATAVGFVVTLYYEMRLIASAPEMLWLETERGRHPTGRRSAPRARAGKRS